MFSPACNKLNLTSAGALVLRLNAMLPKNKHIRSVKLARVN